MRFIDFYKCITINTTSYKLSNILLRHEAKFKLRENRKYYELCKIIIDYLFDYHVKQVYSKFIYQFNKQCILVFTLYKIGAYEIAKGLKGSTLSYFSFICFFSVRHYE